MDKQQIRDILERVIWTLVQGASAVGIITGVNSTFHTDIDVVVWGPLLTAVLSLVKSWLATKFGDGSASTVNLSGDQGSEEDDLAAGLPTEQDTADAASQAEDATGDEELTNPVDPAPADSATPEATAAAGA